MSFQVGIGSLGGTVFFSGGTLHPSVNYGLKCMMSLLDPWWLPYQRGKIDIPNYQ